MDYIQNLYEAGKITPSEMSKLSEIRERFWVALEKGAAPVAEFIQEEFKGCEEEELDKLAEMVNAIERNIFADSDPDEYLMSGITADASLLEKIGGAGTGARFLEEVLDIPGIKPAAKAALVGGLGVGLLSSLAHGINLVKHPVQEAMDRATTKRQSEATLSNILKKNPELKADKKTIQNFSVLQQYAPQTVATNPPLAETMLKKMQQWGGVDPQSLQQMISMEQQHMKNIKEKSLIPETQAKPITPSFSAV